MTTETPPPEAPQDEVHAVPEDPQSQPAPEAEERPDEDPSMLPGEGEEPDSSSILGGLAGIFHRVMDMGEGGLKWSTDMRIPKEVILYGKEQIGSLRRDVVKTVGAELKNFLGSINMTQELLKIFTLLTFEVKMQIRLVPSENGKLVLQPKTEVKVLDASKENKEGER